jgi:methyl-CpG-binding domain protein 4
MPPVSPYGLIQETLWPDRWKILVACIMLNLTTRKAMEKILPSLFKKYPDAVAMASACPEELSQIIAPLGFRNRRTKNLIQMSKQYLGSNWKHARELPGIGEYGAAAWDIFVLGNLPDECPKDGALTKYYKWRKNHGG